MEWYTRMFLSALILLSTTLASAQPVDINTADAQALADNLSGIGLAKAEAIVTYREQNGPFRSAEDLTQVKGVGERILELNRDSIMIGNLPGHR